MPRIRLSTLLVWLGLLAGVAAAQPVVDGGGILNAASYALTGLPNSSIAQGSIFVIFGRAMGPATLQQAGFPLPTELAGTRVKVTVGGRTVDALMVYTSATQVACVLPSATPTGTGTLQLTYLGQTSTPSPVTVTKASFGVLALNEAGTGPGLFTDASYSPNTLTWSAQPNEVWTLWGTGLGPVNFDESRGAPPRQDMPESGVEVYVGLRKAEVLFRGRAPNFSGLDQVNFRVPPGVEGCYVPVVVKVGDVVSNFVTLSVAPAGKRTCSDQFGLTDTEIEQAKGKPDYRIGTLALAKTEIALPPVGPIELNVKLDTGIADFVRYDFNRLIRTRGASGYAPFGQCVVYPFKGQDYNMNDPVQGVGLDAGNLSVTG
ncbi:MAG: hypothetical protein FJW34_13990, partial [Acidobacteria bacterium]|nr:hypothetical protein [Acidobacteriota bacterium]